MNIYKLLLLLPFIYTNCQGASKAECNIANLPYVGVVADTDRKVKVASATEDVPNNLLYKQAAILLGHNSAVKSVIQLSDGRLASCSLDKTIRIWDLNKDKGNDPKSDQQCVDVLTGHTKTVYSIIQLVKSNRLVIIVFRG